MALIAADRFRLPQLAVTHPLVELWETALFAAGLRVALDVPARRARVIGLALGGVFVAVVSRIVR